MTQFDPRPPSASHRASASHADHGEAGFSLPELLVALVIIGVLVLMAVPRLSGVTARAKMVEAKLNLKQVHTLQQTHFYERDTYAEDLTAIGYEPNTLVSEGGTARYRIEIERADADGFMATATAVVDFDRDGTYDVWEVDQDGVVTQRTPD